MPDELAFSLLFEQMRPIVMATPRLSPANEDTIWACVRVTSDEYAPQLFLLDNSTRAHNDKKTGGPWYTYDSGSRPSFAVPKKAKSVKISVMLLNKASKPTESRLVSLFEQLEAGLPTVLSKGGTNALVETVVQHGTNLLSLVLAPNPALTPLMVALGQRAVQTFGSLFLNHDAVVFFDQVEISKPKGVKKGKKLEFRKVAKVSERAEYELWYSIVRQA
ncbi:hypothetical protein JCM10207_000408 [Rhodosporidiobolus poonsookiae]